MHISSGTVGAISASIAIPLFMGLMRKFTGLAPSYRSAKTMEQLSSEYAGWEIFSALASIVFTVLIGLLLWKIFTFVADRHLANLAASRYIIGPPEVLWGLPALFLGIFSTAIPMHFFMAHILGKERYSEFIEYGNRKHKLNTWKLLGYMAAFLVPVIVAFTVLAFDSYIRITDQSFIVNRYFSLGETRYTFADIKYIELTKSFKAPNGKVVRRTYYTIGLNDGTDINFHNSINEADLSLQSELASFVSQKSGVEISMDDPYPQ